MTELPLKIIVVDDSPEDAEILSDLLHALPDQKYDIDLVDNAAAALRLLRQQSFDCVFIDINMPGHDGLWILSELQLETISTPIIMMTGHGDEKTAVQAMKLGAQDYLSKNDLSSDSLHKTVRYAIAQKKKEMDFLSRATRDPMTGIAARYAFKDAVQQAIARAERSDHSLAVLFIDLDKFKEINDNFGHETGDKVLIEACQRMGDVLRQSDTLGRFGGDEFVVLIEGQSANIFDHSNRIAERLHLAITQSPYNHQDQALQLGASIGIAHYPASGNGADELLSAADQAMYLAKADSTLRYAYHEQSAPSQS